MCIGIIVRGGIYISLEILPILLQVKHYKENALLMTQRDNFPVKVCLFNLYYFEIMKLILRGYTGLKIMLNPH